MGLTYIEGTVRSNGDSRTLEFHVDSGATYTLSPHDVWHQLGLQPKRRATFTLADGTKIARQISECHISLAGQDVHTPVMLGEPGDEPLLGVITLEVLGLMLDPFKRTPQAMQLRLG